MSWFSWNKASRAKLEEAENVILQSAQREAPNHGPAVRLSAENVETGYNGERIHIIRATRSSEEPTDPISPEDVEIDANLDESTVPIVIWHGFGSGAAMFANNLIGLSQLHKGEVIAVDLLGCGLSSRPKWDRTSHEEATRWFLDSFERTREKLGIEKFVLLGHSLGGYLAGQYALQYPDRVKHLVLASPVGVPEKPVLTPEEQLEQDAQFQKLPWRRALLFKTARKLWDKGATPQSVVRVLGPMGRSMVSSFIQRRFENNKSIGLLGLESHTETAIDYFYHNAAMPASGDKALNYLLSPGAWAMKPLLHDLPKLVASMPVSFLYGDRDWMDPSPVQRSGIQIHSLDIVPDAGHHLYVDNWKYFNATVYQAVFGVQ